MVNSSFVNSFSENSFDYSTTQSQVGGISGRFLVTICFLCHPAIQEIVKAMFNACYPTILKTREAVKQNVVPHVVPLFLLAQLGRDPKIQTMVKTSGKVIGCFVEFGDFLDSKGVKKGPEKTLRESWQRLSHHDLPFANCVDFMANQAGKYFFSNYSGLIQQKLTEWISIKNDKLWVQWDAKQCVEWILTQHHSLIEETIQANIMHMVANLTEASYKDGIHFKDNQKNPFGRILSVLIGCFLPFKQRLQKIEKLSAENKEKAYESLFQEISSLLLSKIFPKGKNDIQLFHPILPVVGFLKGVIWEKMNEDLPVFLMHLYKDTQLFSDSEFQLWKQEFEAKLPGLQVDQLMNFPSKGFKTMLLSQNAKGLDSLVPLIKDRLQETDLPDEDVDQLSTHLVQFTKELVGVKGPVLQKAGAFLGRYLMINLLRNFSAEIPNNTQLFEPLHLLKQWIEGDLFNVFAKKISGKNMTDQEKSDTVQQLLSSFGLTAKNSFPLPECIKKHVWDKIDDYLKNKMPSHLMDAIPVWSVLKNGKGNKKKLNEWFADPSYTKMIFHIAKTVTDQLFTEMQSKTSITGKISKKLTVDQRQKIDAQWNAFLAEGQMNEKLKTFAHECLSVFGLQICRDLYRHYEASLEMRAQLTQFFFDDSEKENIQEISFSVWLFAELNKAFQSLNIEDLSDSEREKFSRAIVLKNAVRENSDSLQLKKDKAELYQLWIHIKPKFDQLLLDLLKVFNYRRSADLPFPKEIQEKVWKTIFKRVPYLIFENGSDLLLPLLEKKKLEADVKALPHGDLMSEGCKIFAEDIVDHLPEWLDDSMNMMPKGKLSSKARGQVKKIFKKIINAKDDPFVPIWQWVKSYLEGVFLKIASRLGKITNAEKEALYALIQQTKSKLLEEKEEANKILIAFTDQLFDWIGIDTPKNLYGIPQILQEKIFKKMKSQCAKKFLGLYRIEHRLRHHPVQKHQMETHLPTTQVAKSALSITRYIFDRTTDLFLEQEEGEFKGISQFYRQANGMLFKWKQEDYQIASFGQRLIANKTFNPALIEWMNFFDAPSTQSYKHAISDWINPLLTDRAIEHVTTLLKKEEKEQQVFDHAILKALLPVIKQHFKHLHQASKGFGGLNLSKFIDVAKNDLHPAIAPIQGESEAHKKQRQASFYQKQAHLIFNLIFPGGKKDVSEAFSDLDISEKNFNFIQKNVETSVADQLPQVLDTFFNEENLVILLTSGLEEAIKNLDIPIVIRPSKPDQEVGEVVSSIAQFFDLPVEKIGKAPFEAVGGLIRERFNGDFFAKQIPVALAVAADKKHVKLTLEEKEQAKKDAEKRLNELERELVRKAVVYLFRYIGAFLEHSTDIFSGPVMNACRNAIILVTHFVMVKILGSLIHALQVDRLIVDCLHKLLHYRSQKLQDVFSKPELHENLLFKSVEAFEKVLMKG